jgi:hypothetical protein
MDNILELTPAAIAELPSRELENVDSTICNMMRLYRHTFSAGQIVLLEQIKDQCRRIAKIRKVQAAINELPDLIREAAATTFTDPARLEGLDELCAKHGLHVSDGSGWCCQTYKGVEVTIEANETFGLAGYTLQEYRPAFVQELKAINAAYDSR